MKPRVTACQPRPAWAIRSLSLVATLALTALLPGCATPPDPALGVNPTQPEGASAVQAKPGWRFQRQAVAAAHPLAAEAGARMLREGGGAIDAAVAAQMVLTLVEPQSSGIGGGAFLLHHDGRRVQAYDGRETAPSGATPDQFLDAQGQALPFAQAVRSGRSVGVPHAVVMLALAHRQHGRLPWARLFEPAIELAEEGFPVGPRLHTLLTQDPALRTDPVAAAYFYRPDGQAHPVGHRLRNPELATVLRALAAQGPSALHEGPVARAIVEATRRPPGPVGTLSLDDLQQASPREREALCLDHEALGRALRLCGFPPPSSGMLAIGQVLGLLARAAPAGATLGDDGLPPASWLHAYLEASRLAFADRAAYVADPDHVAAPAGDWRSLWAASYLDQRARLIGPTRRHDMPAGQPAPASLAWAPMPEQPEAGTSHLSVVDRHGHTLAMTTTIESAFGARRMVNTGEGRLGGFLLNNQLTDFSFLPQDAAGRPVANRVAPGKRPRSSMSPTLVLDRESGEVLASLGSPGGALIIHFTAKTLIGMLHWGLSPQAAIDLPNVGTLGGPALLEAERWPATHLQALRELGHPVQAVPMPSGLQALQRDAQGGWQGGADGRREGIVVGE